MRPAAAATTTIIVGLGEVRATADPEAVLASVGLGSCVAVCAHDPSRHVGGVAHILLPASVEGRRIGPEAKFADRAVPLLVDAVARLGADTERLVIKLVGGAQMINGLTPADRRHIGERNVEAARAAIRDCGLSLRGEDTGGGQGRTARLYVASGTVVVSLIGGGDHEI